MPSGRIADGGSMPHGRPLLLPLVVRASVWAPKVFFFDRRVAPPANAGGMRRLQASSELQLNRSAKVYCTVIACGMQVSTVMNQRVYGLVFQA